MNGQVPHFSRKPAVARGGAEESLILPVVGAKVLRDTLGYISNVLGLAGNMVPRQMMNINLCSQLAPPAVRSVG